MRGLVNKTGEQDPFSWHVVEVLPPTASLAHGGRG